MTNSSAVMTAAFDLQIAAASAVMFLWGSGCAGHVGCGTVAGVVLVGYVVGW
jgi:hypothetical protein